MKTMVAVPIASALLVFWSGEAIAAKRKNPQKSHVSVGDRSTSTKVYGSRPFDETQYYERLSERIPFGAPAWCRQKQLEGPPPH